jgi:hypothetical protein
MSRTSPRLLALVATVSIVVATAGCHSAKEAPTTFAREDAPGETMTLLPTHSVKLKLASFIHDVPHFGIFELKSGQSIVSGTYTYASNEKEPRYTFEAEGGKKWTATVTDGVLKDEQGNTWLRQREPAAIR